ncbi:MAG: cadmium transporter [Bacillus thermozeamaize]|uniref:Cd(2+)-exporting ATPase n=1 Tax=Bacillus thermozeamaize TaxID=230954 RepID=A0A1Y3PM23_9BACI|nr:MAG: cadmium transporter [Bacillus thermozeamaize]
MPGVREVELNFVAAKLSIEGDISDQRLQKEIRKIEDVTILPVKTAEATVRQSFLQANGKLLRTGLSLATLLLGLSLGTYESLQKIFLLSSILIGGYPVAQKGLRNLLRLNFDMNVLMTIAITGALIIGEWNEAAVVAFLFAVSEMLESYSMEKARQSIRSLMELAPREATVLRNGQEVRIPVEEVNAGDILVVKPGEKISLDGIILEGATSVNEAPITGESMPVEKEPGDPVYAGTLNQQGAFRMRATKRAEDTTLARIIQLVEKAQGERAPSQAFVDRFAKVYTPLIILMAAGVALIPPLLLGGNWNHWVYEALALLVVACPCALVISTPVAIVSAIGAAARNGVLVKGGIYLEEIGRLRAIAFDKTGTLTMGKPEVTDLLPASEQTEEELLRLAAGLEARSEHPLARAIIQRADEREIPYAPARSFYAVPGKGAEGEIDGIRYWIGKPSWAEEKGLNTDPLMARIGALQKQGKTVMLLGTEEEILGLVAVSDPVRPQSVDAILRLRRYGIKTRMLTGDNRSTAAAIAQQVGVDDYEAELLPEEKLQQVRLLLRQYGTAAMVGDGINDAPALAAASVGIAMGGAGTDTALETADVVLMGDDLLKLPFAIHLGQRAVRVIRQNIAFSLGTKLLAVLLVFPGWLTLWLAILADMGATILVTLNGMRLFRTREM